MLLSSLFSRQFWVCCLIRNTRRTFASFKGTRQRRKTHVSSCGPQLISAFKSKNRFSPISATFRFPIHTSSAMSSSKLDSVSDVDIDEGRFKYILIKLDDNSGDKKESKYIVRGYSRAAYHGDIYDEVEPKFKSLGIKSDCVGGGRILHDVGKKTIEVFGYSTGYGKADHSISTEILKKKYPDYAITWSDEGY